MAELKKLLVNGNAVINGIVKADDFKAEDLSLRETITDIYAKINELESIIAEQNTLIANNKNAIDNIHNYLPSGTIIGLKHSNNQYYKTLTLNGQVYNPVNSSPVPPGFSRHFGGDYGASGGNGYYWYEKN